MFFMYLSEAFDIVNCYVLWIILVALATPKNILMILQDITVHPIICQHNIDSDMPFHVSSGIK